MSLSFSVAVSDRQPQRRTRRPYNDDVRVVLRLSRDQRRRRMCFRSGHAQETASSHRNRPPATEEAEDLRSGCHRHSTGSV